MPSEQQSVKHRGTEAGGPLLLLVVAKEWVARDNCALLEEQREDTGLKREVQMASGVFLSLLKQFRMWKGIGISNHTDLRRNFQFFSLKDISS